MINNLSSGTNQILLVEDEPAICSVCQRTLTTEGFKVDIAGNGKVAQEMVLSGNKTYTLCLIDIRTPEMNGKELYHWLEKEYPELTNGVIFTTGDVMGGDIENFLEQAHKPFLPKPFTPDELITIVREALSLKY